MHTNRPNHYRRFAVIVFVILLLTNPIYGQKQKAPLFENLGDHHHPVTSSSEKAQRYFDQGLILAFGFNHAEAHRSFMQAARIDPDCAMAWWGAALVLGPNINAAMDPANAPKAWELTQKAIDAADQVTPKEQAYIKTLTKRYGPEPLQDRSSRNSAYARAMGKLAAEYPDDLDARVLYAESLMDTTPWEYWLENGEPKRVTTKILSILQSVLRRQPDHPMANHLYIHTVEAQHPERGIEEARRLENLVPGAGHLVHMPSHIYIRTGQYHKASQANLCAIEADINYKSQVEAQGAYKLAYVPHNYHFLWATATLEGRSNLAIQTAREMATIVDTTMMRERGLTTLQHYWITPLYALVRFGKWDAILDHQEPAEDLIYPRAVWHYARGMAFTRKENFATAEQELQALSNLINAPGLKWVTVWDINKSRHILDIAYHALAGELEAAKGNYEQSVELLQKAVTLEDDLNYDEPPTWHYPTRQSLGAVLLKWNKINKAEQVYRQNLEEFPDNGWSLYGLLEALRRQGKLQEAEEVEKRFREAWLHADIILTSSRF